MFTDYKMCCRKNAIKEYKVIISYVYSKHIISTVKSVNILNYESNFILIFIITYLFMFFFIHLVLTAF